MANLVVAKQAARSVNNEAEPLLTDTTKLADEYTSGEQSRQYTLGLAIVFACWRSPALLLVGKVFLDDARIARAGQRAGEQAQPGSDSAAAERDGQPRDGDLTVRRR